VKEMKRIYYTTARRLGYREFSAVRGADVVELKRMLHALGYWRKEMKAFPEAPEFDFDPANMRSDPEGFKKAIEVYRKQAKEFNDAYASYDGETVEAVDAFRKENGLDFAGNPDGLVDERLVTLLREKYYAKVRSGK
jgi:hypothetical protein